MAKEKLVTIHVHTPFTLTLGDQTAILKQTEAWAKGAVYQAGDLIWEAKGQEATLKQGKKIVAILLALSLCLQEEIIL